MDATVGVVNNSGETSHRNVSHCLTKHYMTNTSNGRYPIPVTLPKTLATTAIGIFADRLEVMRNAMP